METTLSAEEILDLIGAPIPDLLEAYKLERLRPEDVIEAILEKSNTLSENAIWITQPNRDTLQPFLDRLAKNSPASLPLWGIPFAVKDNIDVAGMPTTAGCPGFAYTPTTSAFAVEQLIAAGAVPIGKTNLDQFATGLVGVRSPYGIPFNPSTPTLIPGGSSSGSAIAMACGLVSFALGTDTAGSGRIPAAFNGLTGSKLTRGLISTSGVVPACRSLDCVSLFTRNARDAALIASIATTMDDRDPFARPNLSANAFTRFGRWSGKLTLGVIRPEQLKFFGDDAYADAYQRTLDALSNRGVNLQPIDFSPFQRAAAQLYEGPWVAERFLATADILTGDPEAIWPVTRQILEGGQLRQATEVFRSIYDLAALRVECVASLRACDALLTPTAGKHFTAAELEADPFGPNNDLGHYTNYMNLLDLCGLALPGLDTKDERPFGVSLVGDRFQDARLLAIGARLEEILHLSTAAHGSETSSDLPDYNDIAMVDVAVCGAHMANLPLNPQLTSRGATFVEATKTAGQYRLFALAGGPPMRPGMIRDHSVDTAIEVEIWRLPAQAFASFVAEIPSPLGIGLVTLQSGQQALGFLCEQAGLEGATEITHYGGWRAYLDQQQP